MFLIMSSAYVDQALKSEFGSLPPCMLPLGNRRLFQHQVLSAPQGTDVFLTLPEEYEVNESDQDWFTQHSVTIVRTPSNISLGAAIVAALNLIEQKANSDLHILFGDTLITPLPNGNDIVAIAETNDNYDWARTSLNSGTFIEGALSDSLDTEQVVTGYFKFSQPKELVRSLTRSHWNFIKGLNDYSKQVGLTSVQISNWLDFGHINTYYHSKANFTTQRAFNSLKITPEWIEKSSEKQDKIKAEAHWFKTIPYSMRGYTPQYLGDFTNKECGFSYRLEYLYYTALNELFVFGNLPASTWNQILGSCLKFIELEKSESSGKTETILDELFGDKTEQRVQEYCVTHNIQQNEKWNYNQEFSASISDLIQVSQANLPASKQVSTVMHGDFCFSNILYDFRTSRVKTIDPRGISPSGETTIYGDYRYDVAKLSHSILGMYDWIIAGNYNVDINHRDIQFELNGLNKHKETQKTFVSLVMKHYGINAKQLYAMQIQLFLSMLPLHADDKKRQKALFANAFRIYKLLMKED
ncbi:capsular biosynthesis protein [Aliivibrio fischeri]|uniref:capsular biosynthesis protein n=1 Tax=Aliivibrio fischeri TaxID=668 RepID=UPI0012DAB819|nr:capsular biosynthesis protein [Aliivibrio fischeri]MUL16652.1 capsular biosynthesis protein [Aliivibrio fischeri]